MNSNRENLKLLNAALTDEAWDSFQSDLREQTSTALRSTRRRQTILKNSAQFLAAFTLIAALWITTHPLTSPHESKTSAQLPPKQLELNSPNYITQDQMLAMFPKDSCVLAEINGQPQLVFFDPAQARDGFSVSN